MHSPCDANRLSLQEGSFFGEDPHYLTVDVRDAIHVVRIRRRDLQRFLSLIQLHTTLLVFVRALRPRVHRLGQLAAKHFDKAVSIRMIVDTGKMPIFSIAALPHLPASHAGAPTQYHNVVVSITGADEITRVAMRVEERVALPIGAIALVCAEQLFHLSIGKCW